MNPPTVPSTTVALVRDVLVDALRIDPGQVEDHARWSALPGMESRTLYVAVHDIEDRLGVELPLDRLIVTRTVLELAGVVHRAVQGGKPR
ncbi:acyl carrier protein [Actinomadura sp. WMMB 499]|uniref:acyl carrier protein n=1 Tax=Actinomadura sp. WMMB 499 TaxID=1219491 RepID=UPI0012481FF2|nr:acyl carrier protein [Actinomadura sp. WMMB 499]QFG20194.1 acyl carrier protein [Actinomadura sp. WMMB 499]